MKAKTKIQGLIDAIYSDSDNTLRGRKLKLVQELVEQSAQYVEIVARQGVALQLAGPNPDREAREELNEIDKRRSSIHNSLITMISAVNRLCDGYGVERIYIGGDHRREKGDFAGQLINDYFMGRI